MEELAGRPVVFRGGTVLPMDERRSVLVGADVLVVGERIEAVGPHLPVPDGTVEIDASGGIVMYATRTSWPFASAEPSLTLALSKPASVSDLRRLATVALWSEIR